MREYRGMFTCLLLICILTMTIGYAAFSQRLNISGISNISSVWNVKFTNIESTITGSASNVSNPVYTDTTAVFNAELVNPGDQITYDITVTNAGTLDAILDKINMTLSNNQAIKYSYSGISEGDILKAGENTTLQVIVKYSENVTSQPTEIISNLYVTLDYKQFDSENYVPVDYTNYLKARPNTTYWFNNMANDSIESVDFATTNIVPSDVGDNYFDISDAQNGSVMAWYYDADGDNLYEVTIGQKGGVVANANSASLFSGLTNLVSIDFDNFYVDNVLYMGNMFYNCSSLKELDLSDWNTSNTLTMSSMFRGCTSLEVLDISNFDTSNIKTFTYMFYNCSSLKELDVSSFDTSNATNMTYMFSNCSSLESLDVNNFDVSKVTDMYVMFYNCSSLKELKVNEWDTKNIPDMRQIFNGCSSLVTLDLSNWDTSSLSDAYAMFGNMTSLKTIYVSELWTTSKIRYSDYMFNRCYALKGAIAYNSSKVTHKYANYETGYFTYKAASNS